MKIINDTIKYTIALILLTVPLLVALPNCSAPTDSLTINKDAFKFFVIGDWGRNGEYNQDIVAAQMNKTAKIAHPSFIISTGDNFYLNGVASVDDPQWLSTFENIYRGADLFIDWYAVLGNHDYHGNAQAQIDYSKRSRRWRMPARYFSFERKIKGSDKKVLFVFLDTNQFEKSYYTRPEQYNDLIKQDPSKQLAWIDSVLSNSKAEWKFVIGHHHVYTGGARKDLVSETGQVLEPIFKKYGVDAYFCGHEHDLQYIKPEGATYYFVSGAGSELRETGYMQYSKFAASKNGFCLAALDGLNFELLFIDMNGSVLYKTIITKK